MQPGCKKKEEEKILLFSYWRSNSVKYYGFN
nr:MAG TPA: hypothetical protein [Caudoviricetes sp.]